MGGIGNMLFQIAACIGYAKKHNIDYCISKHTLNDKVWKPYSFSKINYCDENFNYTKCYNEPIHSYIEIPKHDEDFYILGYYQSELYFSDYREEIIELFGFDNLETKKGVCSIHVRRGDYLKYPTRHPVVSWYYINQAINTIIWKHNILNFKVFSDDIEWCKANLKFYGNIHLYFIEKGEEINDLKLMAECEHNIIANSTFSWWGAWLNPNKNKTVIAPNIWFGEENSHLSIINLIPETWITI